VGDEESSVFRHFPISQRRRLSGRTRYASWCAIPPEASLRASSRSITPMAALGGKRTLSYVARLWPRSMTIPATRAKPNQRKVHA